MSIDTLVIGAALTAAVVLLIRHFRRQWKNGGRCEGCTRSCVGCDVFTAKNRQQKKKDAGNEPGHSPPNHSSS
jgi:hypothetical protein